MNQNDTLSPAQLRMLVWAGLLAPAVECFPSLLLARTGRGSWLAVLLGGMLALLAARLLTSASDEKGLAATLRRCAGPWLGGGVLLIYMVWLQLLLTVRLRLCADRLLAVGERDGSRGFFLLLLTVLLLRLGASPLSALGRAVQLFLAALLTAAVLILALSLPTARLDRLLPLSLPPFPTLWTAAGVLGWAFPAAFLPVQSHSGRKSHLLALALLAGAQALLLANLGAGLTAQVDVPFFALAKSVGLEGAFQRGESVLAALWILADLSLGGLLAFAQRMCWRELHVRQGWVPPLCVLGAAAAAMWLLPEGLAADLNASLIPTGNLLLGLALPALVYLTDREKTAQKSK